MDFSYISYLKKKHTVGPYPLFNNLNRQEELATLEFLLDIPDSSPAPLLTFSRARRSSVRVKCLSQGNNTMSQSELVPRS